MTDFREECTRHQKRACEAEDRAEALNNILVSLEYWLIHLDPKEHYCGYELDFGIERDEVLEQISLLRKTP